MAAGSRPHFAASPRLSRASLRKVLEVLSARCASALVMTLPTIHSRVLVFIHHDALVHDPLDEHIPFAQPLGDKSGLAH